MPALIGLLCIHSSILAPWPLQSKVWLLFLFLVCLAKCFIVLFLTCLTQFHLFQNIQVEAVFPTEFFKLLYSSANGTYHRVVALAQGDTIVNGQLTAVIDSVSHGMLFDVVENIL